MDAGGWQRWRRPRPTPAEQRQDILLAFAVLVAAAIMTVLVNSMGAFVLGPAPSLLEQFAWNAALAAPLVVRRRYPLAVLVVVGTLFLVVRWRQLGDVFVPSVVLFLAVYTEGAWERNRTVARWARIGVIAAMFAWLGVALLDYLVQPPPHFEDAAGPLDPVLSAVLYDIGFNLLFFLSAYFFGNLAWLSARRKAELEHNAAELRRSQERNTHGAIVAERVRIARDLHDVVAHHVSVMGVQAGAARRVLDTDPELSRAALITVEETARTAVGELRGLLGVLRAEDPPETEPHSATPGLDQLPDLVATARSTGLRVEHGVYGDPRPVPDGVALSVYRVVQEALTNVVRHAGARTADVRVRYLDHAVEVEITDDGRGGAGIPDTGFGLLGMRERVAVHGGDLEAGPRRDKGYRVRATLPVEEKP